MNLLQKKTHKKLAIVSLVLLFLFSGSLSHAASGTPEIPSVPSVSAFTPLDTSVSSMSFTDKPPLEELTAKLPAVLSVTLTDSAPFELPVTWACTEDYGQSQSDTYQFYPEWDQLAYPLDASKETPIEIPKITVTVNVKKADIYLMDLTQAASELTALTSGKTIMALVYLTDSYDVKKEASASAETVCSVSTGQTVEIDAVGSDISGNIWYQVSFTLNDTSYQGYIERKYLAYSDEDFIAFEKNNINIYRQRSSAANFNSGNSDVLSFPDSYQSALNQLKSAHPGWIFVKMETGLEWSDVISNQKSTNPARSLVPSSSPAAWKNGSFDNNWAYATEGIISHYVDPRNFLDESNIFQFELLTYNQNYHTEAAVQNILSTTFMSGMIPEDSRSYASAFYSIGNTLKVSPFHLACRVYQEQGKDGTSPLISGTYPGYNNLYNYFNIGATGQGNDQVIKNGLQKAHEMGWTTRYASLLGGATQISKNYIAKGQNTLYLQKFNVDPGSEYKPYNHQYMQNIMAPSSESKNVKKAYTNTGALDNPFVFRIPVFNNMPASACQKPTTSDTVTLDQTALTLAVDKIVTLQVLVNGSPVSASTVTFASQNPSVASVDGNGTVTGLYPGTATITCTKGGTTAACQVTVQKAAPAYTLPALSGLTYDPLKLLANIALPAGWKWDRPDMVPTPGIAKYPATFIPADTGKYDTVKAEIPLSVAPAVPAYTAPTGLLGAVGSKLSSISLPSGWSWETPDQVLEQAGSGSYSVSYSPDPTCYQTVTGISVTVKAVPSSQLCTTHTFDEWKTSVAAVCTAAGEEKRVCSTCGQVERKSIAPLGHSFTSTVTKEASETEPGIRTYTCSRCSVTYTEVMNKLDHTHSYTPLVTREATCTDKGTRTYTCSCGSSYSEEMPSLGHSYESSVTKEATEAEDGIRTYVCSRCKVSYTEKIGKLPSSHKHSYTETTTRQASCTEKGVKLFTCSCGDTYTQDISPYGHDMKQGVCSRCGYKEAVLGAAPPSSNGNTAGNTAESETPVTDGTSGTKKPSDNKTGESSQEKGKNQDSGNSADTAKSPENTSKQNTAPETQPGSSISVDMQNSSVLYEETLQSARGERVDLILNMGNNISWTIRGTNITGDDANGIDMGVSTNQGHIPAGILETAAAGSTYLELSLAHRGALPFLPSLTVNLGPENAGRIANLFYYNEELKKLEYVAMSEITASGDAAFIFDHASDYAVIITDTPFHESIEGEPVVTPGEEQQSAGDTLSGDPETPAKSSSFQWKTIVIIAFIFIVSIGIGVTLFLFFQKKNEDEEEGNAELDEEEISESYIDREEQEAAHGNTEDEWEEYPPAFDEKKELDEYCETDSDYIIDDYHEPGVTLKKTGKVGKLHGDVSGIPDTKMDAAGDVDDEFDGFE